MAPGGAGDRVAAGVRVGVGTPGPPPRGVGLTAKTTEQPKSKTAKTK